MKAITQDRYGAPDVLSLREIDTPGIAADEVLVRVAAAGVDRGTWHVVTGRPYLMRLMGFGLRTPKNPVPGRDVAGVVEAVGAEVSRVRPGEEVYGVAEGGAFAEHAVVAQAKIARKPANLDFEQAATVPISGFTALQALRDAGRVQAGQKVLVVGASGGVGTYAVQLAKAFGAHVTGVASTAKLDLVRSLGADRVIDYTREDFADGTERYDLVIDIGGRPSLSRLRRALTPTGTAVIVGGESDGRLLGGFGRQIRALAVNPFVRQRLVVLMSKENREDLLVLRELVEAGKVTPVVERTFPLAEAAKAIDHVAAGHARGKVVVTL